MNAPPKEKAAWAGTGAALESTSNSDHHTPRRGGVLTPSGYQTLAAMRARRERPLGGVVVTDAWKITVQAERMDLLALYFRKSDRWHEYELSALQGLDVLVKVDGPRALEALAAVSAAKPRSLRLQSGDDHQTVFGAEHAAAETMTWIIMRAQIAARKKAAA